MQLEETIGVSFPRLVESQPLENVLVLADGSGLALGVQRAFSARVWDFRDGGSGLIASRCVEIPLVGSDGEVSGTLYHPSPPSYARGATAPRRWEKVSAIAVVAQLVAQDINNLVAVIENGLRQLERHSDAANRKTIVNKMQSAITRSALLSRQLLGAQRPSPKSIDGFVAGGRLAVIAETLDRALPPDTTVRTEISPDLWTFNSDAEDLYFALLDLCRNSADAMPDGGVITVAARNVELSSGPARRFVEIVVADARRGMSAEVLSQTFTPNFTTKAGGSGTGLGLPGVERFAQRRDCAVCIESKRGSGSVVRLFLRRAQAADRPGGTVGAEIAYTPSPNGGVFHVINPGTAPPTS
jgi:signal transduction histidine kinase